MSSIKRNDIPTRTLSSSSSSPKVPPPPSPNAASRMRALEAQLYESQRQCAALRDSVLVCLDLKELLLFSVSDRDEDDQLNEQIDHSLEKLKGIFESSPGTFKFIPEELTNLSRPQKKVEIETVDFSETLGETLDEAHDGTEEEMIDEDTDEDPGCSQDAELTTNGNRQLKRQRNNSFDSNETFKKKRLPEALDASHDQDHSETDEEPELQPDSASKKHPSHDPPRNSSIRRSTRIAVRSAEDEDVAHPGRHFRESPAHLVTGQTPARKITKPPSSETTQDSEDFSDDETEGWASKIYEKGDPFVVDAEGPELSNPVRTKGLYCPVPSCELQFDTRALLDDHLLSEHQIKQYQCIAFECGETFETKSDLDTHHTTAHAGFDWWRCEECSYEIHNRAQLQTHYWVAHEGGVFACDVPGCDFETKYTRMNVIAHQRRDHKILRYICRFANCPKSFEKKNSLDAHIRVHTGERPFVCEYCSKGFNMASNLNRHLHIHSEKKLYSCSWTGCDHAASDMANMIRHVRTRHFGLPTTVKKQREKGIVDRRDPKEWIEKLVVQPEEQPEAPEDSDEE